MIYLDKQLFKKTEGALYGYFKDKDRLEAVKKEKETAENLIEHLKKNIKECNVSIDPYQPGAGEGERVQSSPSTSSYVEKEIIKAIDDMERELAKRIRSKYKLEAEERNLLYKISKLENNIEMLNEECKKFLKLKYKDKLGMREIALEMNMSKNKVYDFRERLVEDIAQFRWS